MKLKLSFFTFLLAVTLSFAQQFQLSTEAEISVLTVDPGESLNDAFGHNGFRIKDKTQNLDVVFGYGKYDFDAPNFYLKFAQGKLNYLISKDTFEDFYNLYVYYDRSVDEQVLNLTQTEKQKLYNYLTDNYKPENRRYLYDFFYDNCATRIRDVTQIATNETIGFPPLEEADAKTFRALIHEHVGQNTWGSFGIDIALGSVIDRKASPKEQQFLPKYIKSSFADAKLKDSKKLVKSSSNLYASTTKEYSTPFPLSPVVIIGVLAGLILFITYKDYKNKSRSNWLDITIFSVTGIIGILLLLLWFATDHSATGYNYNLLWAFPLNIFVLAQLFKPEVKNWFKAYVKFLVIMLFLMSLHWSIGVQSFAIALLPLLIALIVRYIYILRCFKEE